MYGFTLPDNLHPAIARPGAVGGAGVVERATSQRVVDEYPLEGGTSAAIHRLLLADGQQVVLQLFVLDWIDEEPWAPLNEVRTLGLLAESTVPAPQVVAADLDGAEAGRPAVLMTPLPGEVVGDPDDLDRWLNGLLETMTTIHQTPLVDSLRGWAPYPPEGVPPAWTRHRWA